MDRILRCVYGRRLSASSERRGVGSVRACHGLGAAGSDEDSTPAQCGKAEALAQAEAEKAEAQRTVKGARVPEKQTCQAEAEPRGSPKREEDPDEAPNSHLLSAWSRNSTIQKRSRKLRHSRRRTSTWRRETHSLSAVVAISPGFLASPFPLSSSPSLALSLQIQQYNLGTPSNQDQSNTFPTVTQADIPL